MSENLHNMTLHKEFNLLAFTSYKEHQLLIFIIVLCIYLMAVFANLVVSVLVCLAPQLYTPMYFFLCNLALEDIVYVSAILPKLLAITITGDTTISFRGCLTQVFLFAFSVDTESFLLTVMAYDRYAAICLPLQYCLIMSKNKCLLLASCSWILGGLNALLFSLLISSLAFCNTKEINHFYCDMKTMLQLACSNITYIRTVILVECVFLGVLPFALTLTSYVYIISTILRIRTSRGRLKVFSSCSSHLTIVIIFYGTVLSLYMKPKSGNFEELDKLFSMLYVGVVPMLNPLVYSLRNKQVLKAMKKLCR